MSRSHKYKLIGCTDKNEIHSFACTMTIHSPVILYDDLITCTMVIHSPVVSPV